MTGLAIVTPTVLVMTGIPTAMSSTWTTTVSERPCRSSIHVWTGSSTPRGSQKHPIYPDRSSPPRFWVSQWLRKRRFRYPGPIGANWAAISADYDFELEELIEFNPSPALIQAASRHSYRWWSPSTRGRATMLAVSEGRGVTGRPSGVSLARPRCVRSSWK